jgi:hypothetical protein
VRTVSKGVAAATGVAALAGDQVRRRRRREHRGADAPGRWRSVTIMRTEQEIAPGGVYPEPLRELQDEVELRLQPAPGDKGTELSARLREEPTGLLRRVTGDDPRLRVRSALREAKQLVEVGEVLRVDPAPHGARGHTPVGALLGAVTGRAGQEGVL